MSSAEIVDTTVICRSFPKRPSREVVRENLLDTLEDMLKGDISIVTVEGGEGFGKTTLLAQFAAKHADRALSLFIKPLSRAAYDPVNLKLDLAEQLNWLLQRKTNHVTDIDDANLRSLFHLLQKRARSHRVTYYFIVDGLLDIPLEDARAYETILRDVIPLHISDFRFILSGDLKAFPEDISRSHVSKSLPLSAFSLHETTEYLEDRELFRDIVVDLHKATRGVPGSLASVRRELAAGRSVDALLNENDFLAAEWRKILVGNKEEQKLAAVITYSGRELSIDELAIISKNSNDQVEKILSNLPIIEVDSETQKVSFVTEAHRVYGAKRLQHLRKETIDALIEALLQAHMSDPSQIHLTDYLAQAGRFGELLDHLTPDLFTRILETDQSLYPMYRRAELGIQTSLELNRLDTLIRFSLQKAIVTELDGAEVWRSEIEARMALQDYDSAIALAQSTVLKEDRLHLLAIIAKAKQDQGLALESTFRDQIHVLFNQINPVALGERAVVVASDLLATDPDLALKLVEVSAGTEKNADALDWAFARLSILASRKNHSHMHDMEATDVSSRIKDPGVQSFSKAASGLFQDRTADDIIAIVDQLETKNRLFFLRHWATVNRHRKDAGKAIDYALDLLVTDAPYTPKTRDLREIASPLPALPVGEQARHLIGRLDSYKGSIKALGTSVDYVRLELLIAEAESKYDLQAAGDRLLELYWNVREITDLSTKAECTAWFVASLDQVDPDKIIDFEYDLQNKSQADLHTDVTAILALTAEHYHLVRGVIRALAKAKPDFALYFAQSLNVEERRDLAVLQMIKTYITQNPTLLDVTYVHKTLQTIVDNEIRTEAFDTTVQRLTAVAHELTSAQIRACLPLLNELASVRNLYERCKACCFAYLLLYKQTASDYTSFSAKVLGELQSAWNELDSGWQKVDIGFEITASLADAAPEVARQYLKATETVRENILLMRRHQHLPTPPAYA